MTKEFREAQLRFYETNFHMVRLRNDNDQRVYHKNYIQRYLFKRLIRELKRELSRPINGKEGV
jgi:DNA-binding transcriptional MerR regulator